MLLAHLKKLLTEWDVIKSLVMDIATRIEV